MIPKYKSEFLSIVQDNDIMVQEWTKTPLTESIFKEELNIFLQYFKQIKPRGVLWLQEHFDLEIPEDLYFWIEKHILVPQYKAGLRKLAFTIPKAQHAHLSIIDSFNEVNSVLQPRYFLSKDKAIQYINSEKEKDTIISPNYSVNRTIDKTEITLQVDHKHLPHAIRHLDKLKSQFVFRMERKSQFDDLTLRELEVLKDICRGKTTKQIAEDLFLSENTVATHRKSIIKKLNINNSQDWRDYADGFL
ncbi:LuxR C-terminal-related transcriptional regulator [Winogradskyella maritima]|uniref:Response regulator transcription factor n=1 Tax=Winogradskyella maritima TaxID=1517766 RepID=A0ABV8AEG8_9FLAO|nr:LuxR C-terminal-related transcriptional regulator [Winogradskyella maritima]